MDWERRPNVKKCEYQDYCDCPNCYEGIHCNHPNGYDVCSEDDCPRLNGKKWLKGGE